MSDFVATTNALRGRLVSEFTALPLYWPNDDRTPTLKAAPDGFVYSENRVTNEGPASIGKDGERWHRDFGEFVVTIYVPRGSKAGQVEAYAEEIRNVFQTNVLAGDHIYITRRVVRPGVPASGPQGKWFAVPVLIEWVSYRIE